MTTDKSSPDENWFEYWDRHEARANEERLDELACANEERLDELELLLARRLTR